MSDLAEIFNSAIEKSDRCDQCGAITACIGGDSQAKWCCICGAKLWGNHTYAIIDIPPRVWDDEKKQYKYLKVPVTSEVPMPQGYVERPSDYTGDIWIESQMRTYGAACRAAGEAAGYARGVRGERDECAALCRNIYSWPGAYYAGPMDTATLKAAASAIEARSGPKVGKRAALRGEVKP